MTGEQWDKVWPKLRKTKSLARPRPLEQWFKVQRDFFLDIWRIIFDKQSFPILEEPLSPFHPDRTLVASNVHKIDHLVVVALQNMAQVHISKGDIQTVEQFRPTIGQIQQVVKNILCPVIYASPRASQSIAYCSSEELTSAMVHCQASSQVKEEKDTKNAMLLQATSYQYPISILLNPWDIHVHFNVLPIAENYSVKQPMRLEVIPPPGYSIFNASTSTSPTERYLDPKVLDI
ncbi:hypothetical protein F4805DRAFT_424781 [Annulohypoxylon moriforme]|nr:hypothetical protein F4805DRAFT_424781 [Annulohypoxylon moriforme]